MFDSIRETIDYSVENNISFADMMINDEMEREGKSREEVRDLMRQNLNVMREAVEKGTTGDGVESVTGYTGHDAAKLRDYNENNHALSGHEMIDAVKGAVATNEVNAAMGIICATPTAGSSGTIPGVIFKLEKTHNITGRSNDRFSIHISFIRASSCKQRERCRCNWWLSSRSGFGICNGCSCCSINF